MSWRTPAYRLVVLVTSLAGLSAVFWPGQALALGKVSLTPATASGSEGTSQTITVNLDEPIIAPGPGPAYVDINLTSSDPSRVTVDTPTVSYTASEWSSVKTFTLNILHDGQHNATNTVTLSFHVVSNSEYYSNFSGSLVVTITDIDPVPAVAPTAKTAVLADTGDHTPQRLIAIVGATSFLALIVIARRRVKTS